MKSLFAFFALMASVHAETRNVEISFYCLKYSPGLETIHVRRDEVSEPVRLSTANLTNPVTATVIDGVTTFHKVTGDPKLAPLAGKINIPSQISKALVVLVPNASGAVEPYHALLIDHGDGFRLGSYRVVNFSHRSIRGAIGKSYIEAAAGKMTDLELKGEAGTVQGVRFEFEKEGRWNRLTETRCAVRKDRRWLLCIYQDPETQRMNMRSIPDRTMLLNPIPVSDVQAGASASAAN